MADCVDSPCSPLDQIVLPWIVFPILFSVFCWWVVTLLSRQVSSIPFTPPVKEQIPLLPADEVPVLSSQEPTQEQSAVLLRAAGEKDDRPEQLLRASVGEKEVEAER